MTRREHARQIREAAIRLLEIAAEIERPRPIATGWAGPTAMDGSRLAFEAAMMAFLSDDPDHDEDDRENAALDGLIAAALLGIDIPPECIPDDEPEWAALEKISPVRTEVHRG